MTGDTMAQSGLTSTTNSTAESLRTSVSRSRAARELGLKRGEVELAVMLERIHTVRDPAGGPRRVTRDEIERVHATDGYPDEWRRSIRAVGTAEGAELLSITTARFSRLARAGLLTPLKFYLNRYRAVVWLYHADALREFAADEANAELLTGRAPESIRSRLEAGGDARARNWRGRHASFLLRQAADAWERAAAAASQLDPVQIAELVKDPYERAYLRRLRPEPQGQASPTSPDSPAARLIETITTADDPDEIRWLRATLVIALDEARMGHPAPRPGAGTVLQQKPERQQGLGSKRGIEPEQPEPEHARAQERGLLTWLRRRRS
ncbi:DUF6397 family protein [Streptomyces sp. NPDC059009]|uniref:DUF6397 family protein n=1 Tax=Streptomyces sp. NPDC059009 TaxID=3346694 RepID=UPI0036B36EB9